MWASGIRKHYESIKTGVGDPAVTTGQSCPDGLNFELSDGVIWSYEDDAEDTLIPHLIQSGKKTDCVYFVCSAIDSVGNREFTSYYDKELLRLVIKRSGCYQRLIY